MTWLARLFRRDTLHRNEAFIRTVPAAQFEYEQQVNARLAFKERIQARRIENPPLLATPCEQHDTFTALISSMLRYSAGKAIAEDIPPLPDPKDTI